ncbi:hypothetical protein C8J57DRAFT_1212314 [Mycena rebaudengoi]|nr:hypothetical protein C8J57DRAFT_1212314 [Mycena rebaudengoi]
MYTHTGDSQSRARPLWRFRTIHGVLEVMTKFFLACSGPPCPQESVHQTQRDEFLLAEENIAHTHADDHVPLNASTSAGSRTVRNELISASMPLNHVRTADKDCSQMFWVESDVPPKRLKLGPLKGRGVERDGKHLGVMDKIEIWSRESQVKALITRRPLAASKWPTESATEHGNTINLMNFHNTKRTLAASTLTTSENATRPVGKRSGFTSLDSDAPPKRLKPGPLQGWAIEQDSVNMSAVEHAQKHWSEFQDEYPEILTAILPDDIQVQ